VAKLKDRTNADAVALRSAVKVVEAIKALDIPVAHQRRYVDRAIWHVTVPTESLKYRTRFISCDALEILETLDLVHRLRCLVQRSHRQAAVVPNSDLETITSRLPEETKHVFEQFSITEKSRQATVVKALKGAEKNIRSQLRHEHVISRKDIIDALLKKGANVANILKKSISCTVTRNQHDVELKKVNHLKGIDRYQQAKIKVLDSITKRLAPWSG
jgi:hypothetical protein